MENSYKLREIRITLNPGVELIAEVQSIKDVKKLLEDLKIEDFNPIITNPPLVNPPAPLNTNEQNFDDPNTIIELQANLEQGSLLDKKILAFKDFIPQLLRPNLFSNITDALLVLLFAVEVGLKNKSISYEAFKSLYDGQSIKSGSSLSMLLNNIKNAQYLDKNNYDKDRTLVLTPKGAQKSIEILNAIIKK